MTPAQHVMALEQATSQYRENRADAMTLAVSYPARAAVSAQLADAAATIALAFATLVAADIREGERI